MKYGFTLPGRGPLATPDTLALIARRGEALGYDSVLTGDHIVVPRQISSPYPYTEDGSRRWESWPDGDQTEMIIDIQDISRGTNYVGRHQKWNAGPMDVHADEWHAPT